MANKLFSATTIQSTTFPNRIVMSPMCQYSAGDDGKVNNWHRIHYGSRAVGKVGFIIVEATAVEARGRITNKDLGIWNHEHVTGLKELVEFGHQHGSVMGIQLAHAGRKAEIKESTEVIAPSALPFDEKSVTPNEMSEEMINEVITAFAEGAKRANEAGFDVIELHGAHGYLIHQFLSPISNQRTDQYGGTRENRVRFLQEILTEVRKVWSNDKPIFLRVSGTEYIEGGIDINEMVEILKLVIPFGVDVVDVSSGGIAPTTINVGVGYQVPLAEKIKQVLGIPTIAVGMITEPEQAEEIIFNDRADFVALGRELLRKPYWPLHAATKLRVDIEWPVPYGRAKR